MLSVPAPVPPARFETPSPPSQPAGDDGSPGPVERPVDDADIDPGLQKRPRDLDLPPWLKGRYGTAVGRAVHGVLQTIDLVTGDGLDDAIPAQCQADAVPDRAADARGLVTSAPGLPLLQAAAARSAERPVGKEWVCACTSLWAPSH